MAQVVDQLMTMLLFDLLDASVLAEEDIVEPVAMNMGLDLVLERAAPADDGLTPADGGLTPAVGGLTPTEVVAAVSGQQWELHGLSVCHNHGHRGWWFALQASELRCDTHRVVNLDAHITLFYLISDRERGSVDIRTYARC